MRFILVLSCISAVVGQIADAQGPPKPPWRLEPESTTPISVPADIRRAVGLEYNEIAPVKGVAVDLNGDGIIDYLVQSAPSLCGNGGCIYELVDGATRRRFNGSPLYVRAERVLGYAYGRDLPEHRIQHVRAPSLFRQ